MRNYEEDQTILKKKHEAIIDHVINKQAELIFHGTSIINVKYA